MNDFFYESRSKEKIKEVMEEGLRSQAYYRSGEPKPNLLRGVSKLILLILGILGVLELVLR